MVCYGISGVVNSKNREVTQSEVFAAVTFVL